MKARNNMQEEGLAISITVRKDLHHHKVQVFFQPYGWSQWCADSWMPRPTSNNLLDLMPTFIWRSDGFPGPPAHSPPSLCTPLAGSWNMQKISHKLLSVSRCSFDLPVSLHGYISASLLCKCHSWSTLCSLSILLSTLQAFLHVLKDVQAMIVFFFVFS